MATVYKHSRGKSPYWVAVFSDENGVQRHRSTKLLSKEKALAMAERYQRMADRLREAKEKNGKLIVPGSELILETLIQAAQKAMSGRFTATDARKCVDKLLEATGQAGVAAISTRAFLTDWLTSKKATVAEGTYSSYEEKIVSFLAFIEKRGVDSLDAVTVREVEEFRKELLKLGIAPTTINLKLKMIGTAFRYGKKLGYLSVNPFEMVSPLAARNAEKQAFTLDQLRALLDAANEDWRGMILVGACTGARIGDAAQLTWKNIDLKRGTIVYFPGKSREKALSKPHEALVLPDLEKYLKKRGGSKSPEGALFPTLANSSVSGDSGLSLTFRALMDKAGIECEVLREPESGSKGRRVYSLGYHSLRHSCTSLMANSGVKEEVRKLLVGHTSDVHQRYTHYEIDTFRRELKHFPRLTK